MQLRTLLPIAAMFLFSPYTYAEQAQPETEAAAEQAPPGSDTASEAANAEAEQQKYMEWARGIWDSLDRKTGEVKLPNGVATLKVPENFYYLNPADTNKVLVEVWGNPPGEEKQGMLFPAGMTPFDDEAWGVTIDYTEEGYVSDKDADDINYDDMLAEMKSDTAEASKEREKMGYEKIELVGWASKPFYDKESHKLHWAKEIKFGEQEINTLNYNIRVLGRKGYLMLNFIAGMNQKAMIDGQVNSVLAMAEFNPGYRYDEFNPDLDTIAAYGIGGLVAGKVLAQTGLLAAAIIFLKKFGVFILIGLGVLFSKLFKRGKKEQQA